MKRIEAILKPQKVDEVREALRQIDIHGMTFINVKGYGQQKGHTEVYRGAEYQIDFVPKVRLDVVVPEAKLEEALRVIIEAAGNNRIGDGKIFVSTVGEVVHIGTGDRSEDRL